MMSFTILYGLPKYQMYIYCIHLLMPLLIIQLHSIISKILPNLWQKCLEKPPLLSCPDVKEAAPT